MTTNAVLKIQISTFEDIKLSLLLFFSKLSMKITFSGSPKNSLAIHTKSKANSETIAIAFLVNGHN